MRTAYPVIFTDCSDVILIEVPDLGICTESNGADEKKGSIADAIAMVRDAIGVYCITSEDAKQSVAEPSDISDIDITKSDFYGEGRSFVSIVDLDTDIYRKKLMNKSVRRNVTLPSWLNSEADAADINVSKVLQDALIEKLHGVEMA